MKRLCRTCFVLLFLLLPVFFLSGCSGSNDDEGSVIVCNYDNNKYLVELRKDSGDTLVESFQMDKWYDLVDNCDAFNDTKEGTYYLVIYEQGSDEKTYSETFHLDEWEFAQFHIDDTGDIKRD